MMSNREKLMHIACPNISGFKLLSDLISLMKNVSLFDPLTKSQCKSYSKWVRSVNPGKKSPPGKNRSDNSNHNIRYNLTNIKFTHIHCEKTSDNSSAVLKVIKETSFLTLALKLQSDRPDFCPCLWRYQRNRVLKDRPRGNLSVCVCQTLAR